MSNYRRDTMVKESIWTRQRRLQKEEQKLLTKLSFDFNSLAVELDNKDWDSATITAREVTDISAQLKSLTRELEDVDWIVESFDKINERMEKLEDILVEEGIGI